MIFPWVFPSAVFFSSFSLDPVHPDSNLGSGIVGENGHSVFLSICLHPIPSRASLLGFPSCHEALTAMFEALPANLMAFPAASETLLPAFEATYVCYGM